MAAHDFNAIALGALLSHVDLALCGAMIGQ